MDRWVYSTGPASLPDERHLGTLVDVRLYDGERKTDYKGGTLQVTTHRLLYQLGAARFEIPNRLIVLVSVLPGSWRETDKLELSLQSWETGSKPPGPESRASSGSLRLGAKKHVTETADAIQRALGERAWERTKPSATSATLTPSGQTRGIGGIVKQREAKIEHDKTLSERGLADLDTLMQHAKELSRLARQTSAKIETKQGESQLDEAAQLRGIMMGLGMADNDHNVEDGKLEGEIARAAHPLIRRHGGAILLEEAYCAVNRARGTKLVAPDEVYEAAKSIEQRYPQGGVVYQRYPSGIKVLKDATLSDSAIAEKIVAIMTEHDCLSPESYAAVTALSTLVAREQLLMTEQLGHICRDESDRGTYFYINKFLCC